MKISYDPVKRAQTLKERGLDFKDAVEVFASMIFEGEDLRWDYGEKRIITVGHLRERMIVVVWTPRNMARHIISMRKANEKEQKKYRQRLS